MKLKLKNILMLHDTLKHIIDTNKEVDVRLKFKFLGILKSLESPVANFASIRNEKIAEYGTEKEDGTVEIPNNDKETVQKFMDEINAVLDEEVDVHFGKLPAGELFQSNIPSEQLIQLYEAIDID